MEKITYCKKCHAPISPGCKFCNRCGAKTSGSNIPLIVLICVAALVVFMIIIGISEGDNSSNQTSSGNTAVSDTSESNLSNQDITVFDFFSALQDNTEIPFVISPKAEKMLKEHPELFTQNSSNGVDAYTDTTIQYKHLIKNVDNYGDKLILIPEAYVVSTYETNLDNGSTLTELQLSDIDGNCFYVCSKNKHDNIFEGDVIQCYALPMGATSFDNIGGGTTLAIVCANSYINKIE